MFFQPIKFRSVFPQGFFISAAAVFLFTLHAGHCTAQQQVQNDDLRKFAAVAEAYRSALTGYRDQDPKALINAIRAVNGYQPQLTETADSLQLINAAASVPSTGTKKLDLSPLALLADAETMSANDTFMMTIVSLTRMAITKDTFMTRGRKFSPLVREYLIEKNGSVKLWATFNGSETAEVFVSQDGSSGVDMRISGMDGKLVASDTEQPRQCYISFIPPVTRKYCIEISNKGLTPGSCLLMTN